MSSTCTRLPQQAQTGYVPFAQAVWGFPPSCLHSITLSAIFPVPSLGKMEANRKTYVHSGKSRPALSVDYCSASAQPITPDLSLLWGHEWAQQLQGLAGRATRKAVSPSALRFQGAWRSLALSNGHHLEPSYRSNTPAPKIEESKNSIDWAMHKWNYFSRQKSTVREILSLEMVEGFTEENVQKLQWKRKA